MPKSQKLSELTNIFIEELATVGLICDFDETYAMFDADAERIGRYLGTSKRQIIQAYWTAEGTKGKAANTIVTLIADADSENPQSDPEAIAKIKASSAYREHHAKHLS